MQLHSLVGSTSELRSRSVNQRGSSSGEMYRSCLNTSTLQTLKQGHSDNSTERGIHPMLAERCRKLCRLNAIGYE